MHLHVHITRQHMYVNVREENLETPVMCEEKSCGALSRLMICEYHTIQTMVLCSGRVLGINHLIWVGRQVMLSQQIDNVMSLILG
jgi:hypothetical protein